MAISSGRYVSIKSAVVTSIRSSIRGGDAPSNSVWILLTGIWNDNGAWKDNATWNDGV